MIRPLASPHGQHACTLYTDAEKPERAWPRTCKFFQEGSVSTMSVRAWFGKQLYVDSAAKAFDDHCDLIDETVKKLASELMDGFAAFIASKTSREVGR